MQDFVVTKRTGETYSLNRVEPFCAVTNTSYSGNWQQVGRIVLTVSSHVQLSFDIGDRITDNGIDYAIFTFRDSIEIKRENSYLYTVSFYTVDKYFENSEMLDMDVNGVYIEGNEEPPFSGDIEFFGNVLCNNVNTNEGRKIFKLGAFPVPEAREEHRYVEFTDYNCLACLNQICERFETFYTIRKNTDGDSEYIIDFGQEVGTYPRTLAYGQDEGLYQLSERNIDTKGIVTKLLVLGSGDNLPRDYVFQRLRLPRNAYHKSIISDPAKVAKWGSAMGRYYSDVRPTRLGTITGLVQGDVFSFIDNTLDFDPTGGRINVMRSRGLAGFNFDVISYSPSDKKITVAALTDANNFSVPSVAPYLFEVGDKYHVVDIPMPTSYVEVAESNLAIDGNQYYEKISQPQVEYSIQLDKLFAKEVGVIPVVGMMIPIKDDRIPVDKLVRITAISRDLLKNDYDIDSITVSDFKHDSFDVSVYKSSVRSADKLIGAGFTNPSVGSDSGLSTQANMLLKLMGYKGGWSEFLTKYGDFAKQEDEIGGTMFNSAGLIRALMIDVVALAADTALVDNLFIRNLRTSLQAAFTPLKPVEGTGTYAELLNSENVLKFLKVVNGVINQNKYLKIGYTDNLIEGIQIQPQVWMMSDDAEGSTRGNDAVVSSLQPNGIGIGWKLSEATFDPYAMLGVAYDGNTRRAVGLLRGLPAAPWYLPPSWASGTDGLLYRSSGGSLYAMT